MKIMTKKNKISAKKKEVWGNFKKKEAALGWNTAFVLAGCRTNVEFTFTRL